MQVTIRGQILLSIRRMIRINKQLHRIQCMCRLDQLQWKETRGSKRIKEAFNGLIHDSWTEKALRILSKVASSMKLSSKEDQALINVIQANIGPINMYQSLVTQMYVNGHNFKSNHWIIQKFFQKILKVLFLTWLKFHNDQTLKKPSDMAQKLLYKLSFIY